jgi:hypothetical protein
VCAEASNVLRAVAADFSFNCWCLEIPSGNHIRHVPRCVHYHGQGFRLEALEEPRMRIISFEKRTRYNTSRAHEIQLLLLALALNGSELSSAHEVLLVVVIDSK